MFGKDWVSSFKKTKMKYQKWTNIAQNWQINC